MPHGQLGKKLGAEQELSTLTDAVEEADCDSALLLDARDPRRLYMWLASCPSGPSAMFHVLNIHTVAELKLERQRAAGARTLLVFDRQFEESVERKVMKALMTRIFAVPAKGSRERHPKVQHTMYFSWLDDRIWVRIYRITYDTTLKQVTGARYETISLNVITFARLIS